MKINELGPLKSSGSVKKRQGAGATGFAELLDGGSDVGSTSSPSDVAATAALNNLLALQEISEEDVHKKKLVQQGKNMLDVLDNLRRQLLVGNIPSSTLLDLSRQIALQKQSVADPKLKEIIADIELRTAVELAKLEMAAKK